MRRTNFVAAHVGGGSEDPLIVEAFNVSKADRSPVRRNTVPLPTKLRRAIWGQSLALSDCLENFQRRVQTMHVQIGIVLDVRKHNMKDEAVPMEYVSHQLQREDISPERKARHLGETIICLRRTIRNITRVFPGVLAGLNVGLPIVRPLAPTCVAIDASEVSEEVTICFVSRHFSAQQVSKECALAVLSIHAAVLPDLHITTMRLPDLLPKLDRADVRLVRATLQ